MSRDRLAELQGDSTPSRPSGRPGRQRGGDESSSSRIPTARTRERDRSENRSPAPADRSNRSDRNRDQGRNSPRQQGSRGNLRQERDEIEMQPVERDSKDVLFTKVNKMESSIEKIKDNLESLKQYYDRSLRDSRDDSRGKKNLARIDEITFHTDKLLASLRKDLKTFPSGNQIEKFQKEKLGKSLKDVIMKYQNVQKEHKQAYERKLTRQIKIVNPNATQEQIQNAISSDSSRVFARDILASDLRGNAQHALEEAQDQHKDIKNLEQSIIELHKLFMDISMLIETQTTQISTINTYVEETTQDMKKSVVQLEQGVVLAKSSRKKRWCLCMCCFLILIAAGLGIYFGVVRPMLGNGGSSEPAKPSGT